MNEHFGLISTDLQNVWPSSVSVRRTIVKDRETECS